MHLAQLNVARMVAPLDSPVMADFVAGLEHINRLADSWPGFVWRLKGSGPTGTTPDTEDERVLVNLSVWESREALWSYTYRSEHLRFMQRRREWFEPLRQPHLVMWWIPQGVIPTVPEAMERLRRLREEGPSPEAFTFRDFYEPTGERRLERI
ncbi:hypothetical protein GCM10010106_01150 [Thermopolyspora flexuosa]|jgi:hypothetical protein|uniref:Uncharacterized protein DUF3291 n=1 Tax=Thermopolyspora flexuosa TaxID=103836 RepID=A0A543IXX1_9ACTN|nr:DUF3291 domain-containing protein [Thermopolyspora flexuosa]TQM75420.1 uncharacterized protein DUF3291 [Thermopolyspora flexuosa]GGM59147.1 hypothetical protein GCM10010106_01150 [Thermopolyspora flexuosa]